MRTFSIHQVRNVLIAVAVVVIFGATYFINSTLVQPSKVEAGTQQNVSGWAWSENVGWISMNSTGDGSPTSYGVNVDTTNKTTGGTGDFSGYAWSENVGWISFNPADLGGCPSGACKAQVDWSTGKVTGWAKELSAPPTWDGWIKLSDDSIPSWNGKGVKISGNRFSGWAYGGGDGVTGVGWIDFGPTVNSVPIGAQISAPPCTPSDPTIIYGTCTPVATCDGVTYLPGQSYSGLNGVKVGMCSSGSTTVVSCPGAATLVCPATPAPGGNKTNYYQF